MKNSDDLFVLIKSLSKSEKRYFKLHYSDEKVYLKIFVLLERQKEYDPEVLNELNLKQPHVYKNYLYRMILKSLRSCHSENSELIKLYNCLENFDLLYSKGLLKQAEKALIKAKSIAAASGKLFMLPEIYQMEQKILFGNESRRKKLSNDPAIFEDPYLNLKEQIELLELQRLATMIASHFVKSGLFQNEIITADIHSILNALKSITSKYDPLTKPIDEGTKKYYRHFEEIQLYESWIKYVCFSILGEKELALSFAKKIVANQHKLSLSTSPSIYAYPMIYCHAACMIRMSELKENFYKNLCLPHPIQASNSPKLKIFPDMEIVNLFTFYSIEDFKSGIQYFETMTDSWKLEDIEIFMVICHAASLLYFRNGDFKKSLYFSNMILNHHEAGIKEDIYICHLFFRIAIHYELQNVDILDHLFRKAYLLLKEKEYKYPVNSKILKKVEECFCEGSIKKFFNGLQELDHLYTRFFSRHKESRNKIEMYFNFHSWIKLKLKEKNTRLPFNKGILPSLERSILKKQNYC